MKKKKPYSVYCFIEFMKCTLQEIFIAVVCNKSARQNSSMHHEATSGKKCKQIKVGHFP